MTSRHLRAELKTARLPDRAVEVWAIVLTALSALALIEANTVALYAVALALPLAPAYTNVDKRVVLLAAGAIIPFSGPTVLLFVVPMGLVVLGRGEAALRVGITLSALMFLGHHVQSAPDVRVQTIPIGSMAFSALPALAVVAAHGILIGWRASVSIMVFATFAILLVDLGAIRWLDHSTFTSPIFRTVIAILPIGLAFKWVEPKAPQFSHKRGLTGVAALGFGAATSVFIPHSPIDQVVFDESHGRWETVQSSFNPGDFGRSVNYTYSLLSDYAARIAGSTNVLVSEADSLPKSSAVFVLKMPTIGLTPAFSERLEHWVRQGGRLLVVADHTDLYNSAQNLNSFLQPRFGVFINSDAVFDRVGMPNVPQTEVLRALFGRIDANDTAFPWQTGTSLGKLPLNAVELASFGPSFSEPGDYSNQNRFGQFLPRTSIRFGSHTAVTAFSAGKGTVAIVLDSTPWSNFSIFKQQYKNLFRGILHALSHPVAIKIWGWGSVALCLATLLLVVFRSVIFTSVATFIIGITAGAALQIGSTSFAPAIEGRDYDLKVAVGPSARLEFLSQLVGPGERNFSRIISAMAKYGLDPSAISLASSPPKLAIASRWLFIEPIGRTLPDRDAILSYLTSGKNVTFLFAPEQAANPEIRKWFETLGLSLHSGVALSQAEDARVPQGGLLQRRGAVLLRDVRVITIAAPTSMLKAWEGDQFFQVYTVRPSEFPRRSGYLIVSFSSDQFSDKAVGDVWEGIHPASIGQLREAQLGAALQGRELPPPSSSRLRSISVSSRSSKLGSYLLLEDGMKILSGTFRGEPTERTSMNLSPSDDASSYFLNLRNYALAFVESSCPRSDRLTKCQNRMLGPDFIEWMVSWVSDGDGSLVALELLHERRFSGLGATLNVIFGE